MAQYGPKMAPGCPIKNIEKPLVFIGFLRFQGVLGGSLGVLGGSLGGPWPQDGPKIWGQPGTKFFVVGTKFFEAPKLGAGWSKNGQDGPGMGPGWPRMGAGIIDPGAGSVRGC